MYDKARELTDRAEEHANMADETGEHIISAGPSDFSSDLENDPKLYKAWVEVGRAVVPTHSRFAQHCICLKSPISTPLHRSQDIASSTWW